MADFNFTTGPSTLPGVGILEYNGADFSALFYTNMTGTIVKDNAGRTTKFVDYELVADGYATLAAGATNINASTRTLRDRLTAHAGALTYTGRGFDLVVNTGGDSSVQDAAWGPVPELLEFQPLGGGLSAKVVWKVKVRIPEVRAGAGNRFAPGPMLQFNYETSVSYSEDYFSELSISGTLEIPLTRATQATRTMTETVDDWRGYIESRIMQGVDLGRFNVTKRNFKHSRDKRTLDWDFAFAEKPYMDTPPDCTIASGNFDCRPAKAGMGLAMWLCSMRVTYTVRRDRPRRTAWLAFLALLRIRMAASSLAILPAHGVAGAPPNLHNIADLLRFVGAAVTPVGGERARIVEQIRQQNAIVTTGRRAWLIDFNFSEGMYKDSKTNTFSATWRLCTTFQGILLASGLWRKSQERDATGGSLWATSMRVDSTGAPSTNICGAQSWLPNRLDPRLDIIVDFGGP